MSNKTIHLHHSSHPTHPLNFLPLPPLPFPTTPSLIQTPPPRLPPKLTLPTFNLTIPSLKLTLPSVPTLKTLLTLTLFPLLLTTHPYPSHSLTPPQKLIAEAWRILDTSYLDRTFNHQNWFQLRQTLLKKSPLPQSTKVTDAYPFIKSMLGTLQDPYTRFLTPSQYESLRSSAEGDVVGVGVELMPGVEKHGDEKMGVRISGVVEGGPAEMGGVKVGDLIVEVDGVDVGGVGADEVAAMIRGVPGSFVRVLVVGDEGKGKEVLMKRSKVRIGSVRWEVLKGGVGYVKVRVFNEGTAGDVREGLVKLKELGCRRFVLDLRNNPGGYFPGGVDVARLFLNVGDPIVFVFDKNGISDEIDTVGEPVVDGDLPVVVLVNKATASASEILAGALKDNKRARIVGEKTFGKGLVQTVSSLSDGSGLVVTIARYETPGHFDINKKGIVPDIEVNCEPTDEPLKCLPPNVLQ